MLVIGDKEVKTHASGLIDLWSDELRRQQPSSDEKGDDAGRSSESDEDRAPAKELALGRHEEIKRRLALPRVRTDRTYNADWSL